VTRYTLHVPEQLNDGTPVDTAALALIEDRLLEAAGGYTLTHGVGAWRDPDTGTIYREPVALYAVDTDADIRAALRNLADLIVIALAQVAVYITEQDVTPSLLTA
jgi:hypothetical protein